MFQRLGPVRPMAALPIVTTIVFALLLAIILPSYLVQLRKAVWTASKITYPSGLNMANVTSGTKFGLVMRLQSVDAAASQVRFSTPFPLQCSF